MSYIFIILFFVIVVIFVFTFDEVFTLSTLFIY